MVLTVVYERNLDDVNRDVKTFCTAVWKRVWILLDHELSSHNCQIALNIISHISLSWAQTRQNLTLQVQLVDLKSDVTGQIMLCKQCKLD